MMMANRLHYASKLLANFAAQRLGGMMVASLAEKVSQKQFKRIVHTSGISNTTYDLWLLVRTRDSKKLIAIRGILAQPSLHLRSGSFGIALTLLMGTLNQCKRNYGHINSL
jgi:hypothetical protein